MTTPPADAMAAAPAGGPEAGRAFVRAVNYWPARTAMYWWEDVRAAETRRDFGRLADWGFREVRIFLSWEAFQPAPETVAGPGLRGLEIALQAAERCGVGLVPTLFCGHMSGVNWLPRWVLRPDAPVNPFRSICGGRVVRGWGAGDIYADPALLDAQRLLATRLASTFGGHPGLAGWDLGNEFSNVRRPRRAEDAATWSALLAEALAPAGLPVTGGLHSQDLEEDRAIRPSLISRTWVVAAMHGYPLYSPTARAADDPAWVPFLVAVTAAMTGRPVAAQEFGLPDHELGEATVARYAEAVLEGTWAVGAVGAAWWCFADYDASLRHRPPFDLAAHELHFGLVRADGSPKPVLDAWRSFGERSVRAIAPRPRIDEEAWYGGLPGSLADAYREWLSSDRAA